MAQDRDVGGENRPGVRQGLQGEREFLPPGPDGCAPLGVFHPSRLTEDLVDVGQADRAIPDHEAFDGVVRGRPSAYARELMASDQLPLHSWRSNEPTLALPL